MKTTVEMTTIWRRRSVPVGRESSMPSKVCTDAVARQTLDTCGAVGISATAPAPAHRRRRRNRPRARGSGIRALFVRRRREPDLAARELDGPRLGREVHVHRGRVAVKDPSAVVADALGRVPRWSGSVSSADAPAVARVPGTATAGARGRVRRVRTSPASTARTSPGRWVGHERLVPPHPRELGLASLAGRGGELGFGVRGEELPWRGGPPLLPHEQHRSAGRRHRQHRRDLQACRRQRLAEPVTGRAVADLVVVLRERDEAPRRYRRR